MPLKEQVAQNQIHTSWYTDDKIIKLLKHYIPENNPDVVVLDPMLGTDWGKGHNTLKDNLAEYNLDQRPMAWALANGKSKNLLLIPVNLGNAHWVSVYALYSNDPQEAPQVYYFDPLGSPPPSQLIRSLESDGVFPHSPIQNISQRVQNDGYNCGPWLIEVARALSRLFQAGKPIENLDLRSDIQQARVEHDRVLTPVATARAQPSVPSLPDTTQEKVYIDSSTGRGILDLSKSAIETHTAEVRTKILGTDHTALTEQKAINEKIAQKTCQSLNQDILRAAVNHYGFFDQARTDQPQDQIDSDHRLAIELQNQEIEAFLSNRR